MSILSLNEAAEANLISALTPSQFNQLDDQVRASLMASAQARADRNEISYADVPAEVERQMRALMAAAPRPVTNPEPNMSMLSSALSKVGISKSAQRGLTGAVSSFIPGGGLIAQGAKLAAGALAKGSGGAIIPTIGGAIGGTITSMLPRIPGLTGGSNGTQSGCGCRSSGRDSCTGQKLSSQPAPLATFFGGCCPPGRVLRRINNGRDVCIKKPSMNVFNPAALARADRRLTGFARRSTVMLKDMGFEVSHRRKVKIKAKKRA